MPKLSDKSINQQRFIQALQRKYTDPQYANIKYLLYEKTIPIAESFINLAIVEQQEQKQKEEKSLGEKSISHDALLSSYETIYAPKTPINLADIFTVDNKQGLLKHILIEGRAGIGKSTLCQYIAYHWAKQSVDKLGQWGANFSALIWLPLRNLADYTDAAINFPQFIHQECLLEEDQQFITVDSVAEQLKALQGKVLFLLDGYDEIVSLLKEKTAGSHLLKSLLQQEYWLLTSRPYYVTLEIVDRHLETIGFTDENIEHYINVFFKKFKQPKKGPALIQQIKENRNIKGAAHIPINLELICSAWHDSALVANSHALTMTQLYRQVILNLLRRYLKSEGVQTEDLLEIDIEQHKYCQQHLQFLQVLAWKALEQGTLLLSPTLFQSLLEQYRPQNDMERSKFYEAVFKKFHLLKSTGEHKKSFLQQHYYFVHLTFQEYLAAGYIADCICNDNPPDGYDDLIDFANQRRYEPRYEIVWWFVVGILQVRNATKLPSFFSLIAQQQTSEVTIYSELPLIRYLEESQLLNATQHFYKKLLDIIFTAAMNGWYLQRKMLSYLSLSPQLCRAIDLENETLKLLKTHLMSSEHGKVGQLLTFISESRFFGALTVGALVELLQDQPSNYGAFFSALNKLTSNDVSLIQYIPSKLIVNFVIPPNDFMSANLVLRDMISLVAYYAEISDELINFLLKHLEYDENLYGPVLTTLISLGDQKKLIKYKGLIQSKVETILLTSNGWMQIEAAKVLVAIADEGQAYADLIKKIFKGEGVSNRYVNRTHTTYQDSTRIAMEVGKEQSVHILSIAALSALITTQSPIIIRQILKHLESYKDAKSKKDWQPIVIAIKAFTAAKCVDANVVKTLVAILINVKVPVEILGYAICYFRNLPMIAEKYNQQLKDLLRHDVLQICILTAETFLAMGSELDDTLTEILVAGINVPDRNVRYCAIMAVQRVIIANKKLIDGLIIALQAENFSINRITNFHQLIFEILGGVGHYYRDIVENILLRFLRPKMFEDFYGVLKAFKLLNYLPNQAINTIASWIKQADLMDVDPIRRIKNVTILEMIGDLLEYSSGLSAAIKQKLLLTNLDETNVEKWITLICLLLRSGEIEQAHLGCILKFIKQNKHVNRFQKALEQYVTVGVSQQKILLNLLLSMPKDASIFYKIIAQCDLTEYLAEFVRNNFIVDYTVCRNTPIESLLQMYLNEINANQATHAFLSVALHKLFLEKPGFFIYPDNIIWYDTQQHSIELTSQQFERLLQDAKQIMPNIFIANVNIPNFSNPIADLKSQSVIPIASSSGLPPRITQVKKYLLQELLEIKDKYGEPLTLPRLYLHHAARLAFKNFLTDKLMPFLSAHKLYNETQLKSIFISYAWAIEGSPTYDQDKIYESYVEKIAKDLERIGCKVYLDRWFDQPGNVLTDFLELMGRSDFFIPIGTNLYLKKYEKRAVLEKQREHVARIEGQMLNYIASYSSQWQNTIMPILLEGTSEETLPVLLRSQLSLELHKEDYFDKFFALIKKIYGIDNRNKEFEKLVKGFYQTIKVLAQPETDLEQHIQTLKRSGSPLHQTLINASSSIDVHSDRSNTLGPQ